MDRRLGVGHLARAPRRARGDGVALVEISAYGASPGIDAYSARLVAYKLERDHWTPLEVVRANTLEVRVEPDGSQATIDGCTLAQGSAAGCGTYGDADPTPTYVVRYDGTQLSIAP